jgi:hypothetical protein
VPLCDQRRVPGPTVLLGDSELPGLLRDAVTVDLRDLAAPEEFADVIVAELAVPAARSP